VKVVIRSYRFAREILDHHSFKQARRDIQSVLEGCPLFVWPKKSKNNSRLDVVQQLLNTYFDRRFAVDLGWEYHPLATGIKDSELKADFRKNYGDLKVQVEVQFGNMARWYSDIFKFQTAYSDRLINLAVCILPMRELATRIDSNVAHFERAWKELPSAELSITLPILMVGIAPSKDTRVIDVSQSKFERSKEVSNGPNKWRIINAALAGRPIESVGPESDTGLMPEGAVDEVE